MAQIMTVPVGELEANCHIVSDSQHQTVLIDPGADAPELIEIIEKSQFRPLALLLTHAHHDHFGAAADLMRHFQIPLYVHTLDEPGLHGAKESAAMVPDFTDQFTDLADSIRHFEDGAELKFSDELVFTVLHTPGHTPGGSCFLFGDDIMFSGDTLFRGAVGRIDFAGGNLRDMRASLLKIGTLPGNRTVYCGHYENTTLDYERTYSPYLGGKPQW